MTYANNHFLLRMVDKMVKFVPLWVVGIIHHGFYQSQNKSTPISTLPLGRLLTLKLHSDFEEPHVVLAAYLVMNTIHLSNISNVLLQL